MARNEGRADIIDLINGILGSLVSITAGCFLYRAWEAMLIGAIGSMLTCLAMPLFDKWGIDDPVGASAVHGVSGIWGGYFQISVNGNTSNGLIFLSSLSLQRSNRCWPLCRQSHPVGHDKRARGIFQERWLLFARCTSLVRTVFDMLGNLFDIPFALSNQHSRPDSNGSEWGTSGCGFNGASYSTFENWNFQSDLGTFTAQNKFRWCKRSAAHRPKSR